ncbi:MAG: ribosome maturation factor RimM [Gammaproteobacteria bacterium]
MAQQPGKLITMGRISGLFGVRGWVKVFSSTDPRENILQYRPWYVRAADQWQAMEVAEGQRHGKGVIARLEGVDDRDAASALVGAEIAVRRDQLAALKPDEYYWSDLEGLRVVTTGGADLGTVDHLLETGANDVLVVRGERERLIPYLRGDVVKDVDLEQGLIQVDWDPDF